MGDRSRETISSLPSPVSHLLSQISKQVTALLLLITCLTGITQASVSVKVFSKDAGIAESNISKPCIYIQNTGTETINDFYYRYYFETEGGKEPMLDEYYIPNATVMVVPNGNGYYVQYTVSGANLSPGGLLPNSAGNGLGLHYNDWSTWDITNDFSNNQSAVFEENPNIAVFYNSARIYGNEPGGIAGSVLREVWTGISGNSTDDIPLATTPQVTGSQSNLDAPTYTDDNYGARIRGYITAPTTGNYTFYIASDNDSKLYLSTDDDPANKALIASVSGWTGYQSWYEFSSQQSSQKALTAGNSYYIEILHKEGNGGDHCSVGWLTPGQSGTPVIVPGTVLTPYVPAIVPEIPALTATAQSSNAIELTWNDVANELGYTITISSGGGGFSHLVTLTANNTSYLVTGLYPETNYRFKIKSYNATGDSDYSNAALATTFAVIEGKATREIWYGISGTWVSHIPLDNPANTVEDIYQLETPQQFSDYYGERIRGYIIPPTTGDYTFWIASDNNSQLWLSTDNDPANKQMIAWVFGYCAYQQWNKYSSQKSVVKTLTAGVPYYFAVLHKEGSLYDNLSVGWAKPGQGTYAPSEIIPGSVLSPYTPPTIPNDPGGLTASAISATQIDLTWTDNSNNELGFRVERALGTEDFQLVYTTASNATVYHDGGLSANTQYRYRVMAYNGLGNSGYTNSVTEVTPDQSTAPLPQNLELNSFGLYSSVKTEMRDNCVFNGGGGAIGSNTFVELLPLSITNGSVISGGDILLRSQAEITENATAAGTVTLDSSAIVHGDITEGATVAIIDIPEKATITTGTQDIAVCVDQNYGVLPPGVYKSLWVGDRGAITFTAGHYAFTNLFLSPDTKIELDIEMRDVVDIEVEGNLEFSDRSQVTFVDEGYVPLVRLYTNDTDMVRIGCDVQLNGILTAPHGDVHMYSRAECNGAVYAKTITIEPDAVIISGMVNPEKDNDGDKIANYLEVILGTDMNDSDSYVPIAIPSQAWIDNSGDVMITYDYSIFFPEYPTSKRLPAFFPANSLVDPYHPLLLTVGNTPDSIYNTFQKPGYERRGRYISILPDNGIETGAEVVVRFPVVKTLDGFEPGMAQAVSDTGDWQELPTGIINSAPPPAEDNEGVDGILSANGTVTTAQKIKVTTTTLYFDNNVVYTKTQEMSLGYNLYVADWLVNIQALKLKVHYTEIATGTPGMSEIDFASENLGYVIDFAASGKIAFSDPVVINSCELIKTADDGTVTSFYTQTFDNSFEIQSGQIAMLRLRTTTHNLYKYNSSEYQYVAWYPSNAITFESAGFGDGRIIADRLAGVGQSPFAYEYYLKDHLGSTRMVLSDDEAVVEATMYQPYGSMTPLAGVNTSGIPVREKFTEKEFDEEGGTGVGGDGMNLFYFGARYYDPNVGMWTSGDPARQFFSPYSYAGSSSSGWTNPLLFKDYNGEFGPLFHGLVGELSGEDYKFGYDAYIDLMNQTHYKHPNYEKYFDQQEMDWAVDAHKVYNDAKNLLEFIRNEDIPIEFRMHAWTDAYNQGIFRGKFLTWDERLFPTNENESEDALTIYQDAEYFLLGWFLNPIGKILKASSIANTYRIFFNYDVSYGIVVDYRTEFENVLTGDRVVTKSPRLSSQFYIRMQEARRKKYEEAGKDCYMSLDGEMVCK